MQLMFIQTNCVLQPPLQIMQMMYCFINNIHVNYAELLWERLHYSLHHPTSSISYPRFTKIIISHYMTNFPKISRCARDRYHNLKDDDLMKNIFNSGRYKDKVGMKIPSWMILEEMKHTEHYQMYVEVFGIDVPLTQSQPTESTQGTHGTPSAPRGDDFTRHITSLVEHKSQEEQEARETVELVNEHLASVEIEKMVKGPENVIDDSLIPRNDDQNILGTRLEPRSDKESLEVEITNDEEVEIINVVIPVNVNEEEEEITNEVYKLKRMEKGKIIEESRSTPFPTPIRYPRIHTDLVSTDTEKLQEFMVTDTTPTPSSSSPNTKLSTTNRLPSLFKDKPACFKRYKSFFLELQGRYGYLFKHLKARFLSRKSFDTLADHLQKVMVESLPTVVDKHIKEQVEKQVLEQERGKLQAKISSQIQKAIATNIPSLVDASVPQTTCRTLAVHPRDQDDPHDDAHPKGENSAKRQKTSEYKAHVAGESSGQINEKEQEEVSLTINEAELKKIADEMLRQRCTSRDEHQYHIDQIKIFLKSDIRDPESPALSLINQDLLYLKKGNSGPEKIVLSLHKFPAIIFNDNPHAKIFYIKRQKEPRKPKEVVYLNSKIIQVIKMYWEQDHGHKFITEIVIRRANECIVSIIEYDYKNLNKNDIEDIYLLIMNGNVPDYAETGIEKHKIFSIIYEHVHEIIYKNCKKEKWVMRHSEIHKFCDATLNRVLEGLKSYNNDVKCDNGTEFKNRVMNEFCKKKGIKREFSIARTPQQNGVAERRDRILIKAARTMVIIVKPHNKTPYELFRGRTPALSFMRPFRCHVTILNTLDHLGKFDRKSDDGFFVGYSLTSKAFRVYNIRTRKVEENLHIRFLENKPIVTGDGPKWLFDIDSLTKLMNYVPVVAVPALLGVYQAQKTASKYLNLDKPIGISSNKRPPKLTNITNRPPTPPTMNGGNEEISGIAGEAKEIVVISRKKLQQRNG
ncbi:retrovirus-related pol polyprotein from transposon TNT 1-94 [Tanacetum coccineum]